MNAKEADNVFAVMDAKAAISRSGTFKIASQVASLNRAVKVGIVFG